MKRLASIILHSITAALLLGSLVSLACSMVNLLTYPPTTDIAFYWMSAIVFYGVCIMTTCSITHAAAESLEG